MMDEIQKRIEWIDTAKGIGIILVVIGHIGPGVLSGWIYSFHMPLFFFLSGICFNPRKSYKEFLRHKIRTMVIPYFFLGIIILFFQLLFYHLDANWFADAFLKLLVQRHYLTIWYIACLFISENILYFLNKIGKRNLSIAISFVLFVLGSIYYRLGGVNLPWCFDTAIMSMPFMCVGFYGKEKIENFTKKTHGRGEAVCIIVFIMLGLAEIGLWYINRYIFGHQLAMYNNSYEIELLTLPTAFIGIYCTIIVSQRVHFKFLSYLGKNSLIYFAWHEIIMFPIADIVVYEWIAGVVNNKLLLYVLFIVVVMSLCTLANAFVMNTPLKVFLGKQKIKRVF